MPHQDFTIRPMTLADIPAVAAIERASLTPSWPEAAYRRELAENSLAHYLVAVTAEGGDGDEHGGGQRRWWQALTGRREAVEQVLGFLGLWLMVDEAHIVTVAVAPEARRQGVGGRLVREAIALARAREAQIVLLECRLSNVGAQRLYEQLGFRRAGIRRRYYTDNGEDAVIMTTPPLDDPAFLERLAAMPAESGGIARSPATP